MSKGFTTDLCEGGAHSFTLITLPTVPSNTAESGSRGLLRGSMVHHIGTKPACI